MNKGLIAFAVIVVVIIAVAYLEVGSKFINLHSYKTTIPGGVTTSLIPISNTSTTVSYTTINASNSESPCGSFQVIGEQFNTTYTYKCASNGSTYGLWVAAGNSGYENVTIKGADGKVYVNQNSSYNCTTFFQNFTGPAQLYTVSFTTGGGGGSCGNAEININSTSIPPPIVYNYVYNGNFRNGEYTGWNVTGAGFGTEPLNLTYANTGANVMCYDGQPWSNYNGTFFATTYECGLNVAPGNITSSAFTVVPTRPFLNFRIISPQNNQLYVELMNQSYRIVAPNRISYLTPLVIVHVNTYNGSITPNSSSTFENVSIPLTAYINHELRIRFVAYSFQSQDYIAVGDFELSNRPNQQRGVGMNITLLGSG